MTSLLHIACRRGHADAVAFLVEEARVPVHRADDCGKTPLHDACWTPEPNFVVVEAILRASPALAVCQDCRGFVPFDYSRKNHSDQWIAFLAERRSIMVLRGENEENGNGGDRSSRRGQQ